MFWNALGYYQRLECPPGKPLTKKEHVPFEADDYTKLDRILSDRNSILATHSLAYLSKPVEDQQGVDGWSAATPATVQASVVEDAAYTTWAMWRWANGEIVAKLRGLTERLCTPAYLKHLLRSEDPRDTGFALRYVLEHHPSETQFVDDVFRVLENSEREHINLALRFLDGAVADEEELHARLIDSCCRMKSVYSPLVLEHLAAEPDLPRSTLELLAEPLDRLPYFQVHLVLRLLERRRFFSEKTEAEVAELLDGKDFFIARRAYEHLLEQDVSRATADKLTRFREENRDRL
jgi:hypothetical protein